MRMGTVAVLWIVVAAELSGQNSKDEVLSADRIAVYLAFLAQHDIGSGGSVNLGDRSTALEISESDLGGCLKDIDLEDSRTARSTTHRLGSDVAAGRNVGLVDSKAQLALIDKTWRAPNVRAYGLLQLSEIAFDRAHRFAVLSFGFTCGGLCGHGGIVVFEKSGAGWKASNRRCGRWVA